MAAKLKPRPPVRHREVPPPWHPHRNDGARVIDIPGPVIEVPAGGGSMALMPFAAPLPPAKVVRPKPGAVGAAAAKVGQAARAVAAKVGPATAAEPFSKRRVGEAAAFAGGMVGTTLAAGELGLTASKPIAIGVTAAGAVGMAFLDSYWRQLSQGVLGAGVAQLTSALHTERLRAKADKEAKRKHELEQAIVAMAVQQAHATATQAAAQAVATAAPAALPAPAPARNAIAGWDLTPAYAAVEQAHAEISGDDARNAWGWGWEEAGATGYAA